MVLLSRLTLLLRERSTTFKSRSAPRRMLGRRDRRYRQERFRVDRNETSRVIKGEREWFLCVWGEKREGWKDGRMVVVGRQDGQDNKA